MTRKGYDSTTAADLPAGGDIYLGYVDGIYRNHLQVRDRFPNKKIIRVTVGSGTLDADMADCESGDYTPTSVASWAQRKEARDGYAGIYCEQSQWGDVKAEVLRLGVRNVWYVIASYDGRPFVPLGAVGKQYLSPDVPAGSSAKSPGHYDVCVYADHIPGIDPDPKPLTARQVRLAQAQRLLRRVIRLLAKGNHK